MENTNKKSGAFYTCYNYFDVLGNAIDGFEVNNQCIEFDDLWLENDISKKEIVQYMKKVGLLTTDDLRKIEVIDETDLILINAKNGMPLFGLMRNY